MRVFGIDPGSERTGYGCVETDGSRHRIVICGAIGAPASASFSEKLLEIHRRLVELLAECRAGFGRHREPLLRGERAKRAEARARARRRDARGRRRPGLPVVEYTPAEIKRAVVGYGRAEKPQVQHMVKLLLGWPPCRRRTTRPTRWRSPSATCTRQTPRGRRGSRGGGASVAGKATSWRRYRPARP